ncbi:hypothetical protein DFQ27_008558, partial [Actinomortierella ambigua]
MLDTLRDRHIIQFYGTRYHKGMLVLIMDYAEGGSLAKAIDRSRLGHDDWPTKTRLAQEMARGLYYIHQNNIVHRDLKSANVLLTKYMEVKLCDFGLAMTKTKSSSKSSTSFAGTLRWMAPEVFGRKPQYSAKSDMYALGMVMWEMAANSTMPFSDQSDNSEVRELVKGGEREELPENTPAVYRYWVERCWEHDPTKRPDADDMTADDEAPGMASMMNNPSLSISFSESMMGKLTISSPSSTAQSVPGAVTLESGTRSSDSNEARSSISTSWPSASQTPSERARALIILIEDAENNNVAAQVELAGLYAKGNWVVKDEDESFRWYMRAAEQGHVAAQFIVGELFMSGRGTPVSRTAAVVWYRRAAEKNHAEAQNKLGWMYLNGQGIEQEALSLYRKSAEQGNADAQNSLGSMYMLGQGVEQDYAEALSWLRKSAEQGNASAQNSIGWMCWQGQGVDQNYAKALSWLRKSANQGHSDAQNSLGEMYLQGKGVEQDYAEALSWFRKSAEQENVDAQGNLGWMYLEGNGVEQDYAEALSWLRKSAEQGDTSAQGSIGWMYLEDQDYAEALSWLRKSAEQGDAGAQFNLGWMHMQGLGVKQDYAEALSWFRKSAEQGNA